MLNFVGGRSPPKSPFQFDPQSFPEWTTGFLQAWIFQVHHWYIHTLVTKIKSLFPIITLGYENFQVRTLLVSRSVAPVNFWKPDDMIRDSWSHWEDTWWVGPWKYDTSNKSQSRWWFQIFFSNFHPYQGKWSNLTCAYFSNLNGLQPPTSNLFEAGKQRISKSHPFHDPSIPLVSGEGSKASNK